MTRRRYDDDEEAEILARATEGHQVRPAEAERARRGLTLEQLQEIGSEVGIEPARIAEAARSLERRADAPAPRTFLGAPRSVARTVPLPRALGVTRSDAREIMMSLIFTLVGLGQLGYVWVSLPRWAEERASQMEGIAERLPGLLEPSQP